MVKLPSLQPDSFARADLTATGGKLDANNGLSQQQTTRENDASQNMYNMNNLRKQQSNVVGRPLLRGTARNLRTVDGLCWNSGSEELEQGQVAQIEDSGHP
jgi:hypothetical protein